MTEVVPDSDYQSLQHFVTHSPWESRPAMDQVAMDADDLFGGRPDVGLIIDETSFPKAGKKSVGVNRQWCGTLGKVDDNCQVGVFSSLVRGSSAALVDGRLYVPKIWHHHMALVMMSMLFMLKTRHEHPTVELS